MNDNRTKNASRNLIWGMINKSIAILLPFISRTVILKLLGECYLGVGTLFTSILSFLSLTELGLSSAVVYAMYKPIALDRKDEICALLNFYRFFYRIIGVIMLVIGTLLVPIIPYLINGEKPVGINIYALFYIYLLNSVISYFFAGYRSSLLSAYQREDISTKILSIINIFVQLFQVLILYFTKNFYAFAFIPLIGTLWTNLCYYYITKKKYPELNPNGNISDNAKKEIKKRISGLIGTRLNSIVIHSADTIVLSSFIGLSITARYGNYYTIFNAICSFIAVIFTSITAGIGNKLVLDSIDNNKSLFYKISYINAWIVCLGSTCFLCLYEPFIEIWVGNESKLGIQFTCLMTLYFFIYQIQKTILTFKDAAGLWYEDKYRPYVSMTINVVSNLILVKYIGIYGIVLSTIISFLISLPWANKVLFDNLFKCSHCQNLLKIVLYFIITCISCLLSYLVCSFVCVNGIVGISLRVIICLIIPNTCFIIATIKSKEFSFWKEMLIKKLIKNH